MKYLALLAMLSVLLASVVSAEPSFYYKRNEQIMINVPCINNGTIGCTSCNISVTAPNTTVIVDNQAMNKTNLFFNYTLAQQTRVGEYQVVIFCQDTAANGTGVFSFAVTDNGQKGNDYTFIIGIGLISFLLVVIGLFISPDHNNLRLMCFLFSIVFAILIPASFISPDTKTTFFHVFIGFVVAFATVLAIIGGQYVLENMGIINRRTK